MCNGVQCVQSVQCVQRVFSYRKKLITCEASVTSSCLSFSYIPYTSKQLYSGNIKGDKYHIDSA
jgi:hypothetical protein